MDSLVQYQSPFHLLKHLEADIANLTINDIALLKKEALLELQMSPNQFIKSEFYIYSKENIITEFQKLETKINIDFHSYIWNNTTLIDTLEACEFGDKILFLKSEFEQSKFKSRIAPYLAIAMDIIVKDCINKNTFRDVAVFSKYIHFLEQENTHIAYKRILLMVKNFILKMDELNQVPSTLNKTEFEFLTHTFFIETINNLGIEYKELRDDLGTALTNFVYFHNQVDIMFCSEINSSALRLDCNKEIRQSISTNYDAVEEQKKPQWLKVASVIFLLIYFGLKAFRFFN